MTSRTNRAIPAFALALAVALSPAVADEHGDDDGGQFRPDLCRFQFVGAPALPGVSGIIAEDDARTAWQFLLLECPEEEDIEVLFWNVWWLERVSGVGGTGAGAPGSAGGGLPEENPMVNFHGVVHHPVTGTPSAVWDVMIPNLSTYAITLCAWYRLADDDEPDDPFEHDRWPRIGCWTWGQWH